MKSFVRLAVAAVLVVLMIPVSALAGDNLDFLKPIWLKGLEELQEKKQDEACIVAEEPVVVCSALELEIVSSGLYLDDRYDSEMNVYAVLKNAAQETLRPDRILMTVYDRSGKELYSRDYVTFAPQVVKPGEILYVSEWFYDFVRDIYKVGSVEISAEFSDLSRSRIAAEMQVKACIDGEYLHLQIENATDAPVFNVEAAAAVIDSDGNVLDMLIESPSSTLGLMPGSEMVLRQYLPKTALDMESEDLGFVASAYAYSD